MTQNAAVLLPERFGQDFLQSQVVTNLHMRPGSSDYVGPKCGDGFQGWNISDISLRPSSPAHSGIRGDAMPAQHVGMPMPASTDIPLHHLIQENANQQFGGHGATPSLRDRSVAFVGSTSGRPFYGDHPSAFPLTYGVERQWSCSSVQNPSLQHAQCLPAVKNSQCRGTGDAPGGQLSRQAPQEHPQSIASLQIPTFHSGWISHHYMQQSTQQFEELQHVNSAVCPDTYLAPWGGTPAVAHLIPWPQQRALRGVQRLVPSRSAAYAGAV